MVFIDKSKRVSVFELNLQSVAEAEKGRNNMNTKLIRKGTTLYLPVACKTPSEREGMRGEVSGEGLNTLRMQNIRTP